MMDDGQIETDLSSALNDVLISQPAEEIDGLDDDLVEYISGMLVAKLHEYTDAVASAGGGGGGHNNHTEFVDEALEEVLVPFLESVGCPSEIQTAAQTKMKDFLLQTLTANTSSAVSSTSKTTRKLTQGVVSMSSDLSGDRGGGRGGGGGASYAGDDDIMMSSVGFGGVGGNEASKVVAMHNTLIDAYDTKEEALASSKDKRKARKKELEKARKLLSSKTDVDVDALMGGGLVKMKFDKLLSTGQGTKDKRKDIQVRGVTVSLDNGTVLMDNSELKFAHRRRYGLIGENGVGKSTLLKYISRGDSEMGKDFPSHIRVLHVRQEVPAHLSQDLTVMDAVLQSDIERNHLLEQEQELLSKLDAAGDASRDDSEQEEMTVEQKRKKLLASAGKDKEDDGMAELNSNLKQLDAVYARLQALGNDNVQSRAAMILSGLQFSPERQHQPVASLSGGWKMRVALAAALFIQPELLMLDEPTNHLDLEALLWLESYLVEYAHTLVVVSHDRGFLNEVCTDIVEFKNLKLTYYRGNFDNYVKQRDENTRNSMRAYQAYKEKRDHMMEFIEKFRANAKRATMVQSRIKAVQKMDAEAPEQVEVDAVWRFSIPNSPPLGPPIIAVNDVTFDYNPEGKPKDQYLLQKVNFGVTLTSRIAILGANGQGKSTLLKLIMGQLRPVGGTVSLNSGLRIGYFTQHSGDNFDLKISALENMLNIFEDAEDQEMRSFLGKFQIQNNNALKPMMLLSGGQKSRVAFAALAYKKPHVLVIDEGSNHLSMSAVDALIEAIQDFQGGLLVVSHDQHFVSNICSELWVVNEGACTRFRGDFNAYKEHSAEIT
eukprot:CAMPEP_0113451672 /NCGR_PEP_ID=MMETSP0014_2-20120614/6457_1 /TAXON_ID=2857 /ORGANISM="Nitzschia sp." /LENGTH=827 /DNA_ID=CAMNT_0000343031 /DNA_START=3921 /DNA_END=6401 /DNA_ORIENTATION=- /assembly_acc=CAM_ASM_000159